MKFIKYFMEITSEKQWQKSGCVKWKTRTERKEGTGHRNRQTLYAGNIAHLLTHGISMLSLNSVYSDYYNPKFGTDIYAEMAADFIRDEDAKPGKTLSYYLQIVK